MGPWRSHLSRVVVVVVVVVVDIDAQQRATVATPGEWQCKTARSGKWAQHFSNASCSLACYFATVIYTVS